MRIKNVSNSCIRQVKVLRQLQVELLRIVGVADSWPPQRRKAQSAHISNLLGFKCQFSLEFSKEIEGVFLSNQGYFWFQVFYHMG